MNHISLKLLWLTVLLFYTMTIWGQSSIYCGGTPPFSSSIAFVYFFQNTPVTVNNEAVEPGSYIIAVFENGAGEWQCAGEVQWWGYNTIMTIRGEDTEYEGYEEGEALRFYIQSPDGCLLRAVEVFYTVDGAYPGGGNYTQGGRSRVQSLSATFNPQITIGTVADICGAGTGLASIAQVDGSSNNFMVEWSNGESGQQASGLTSGSITAGITTADGCMVDRVIDVPAEGCPFLDCEATANGLFEGDQGCPPFTVNFTDASQSEAGIRTHLWEFGDGSGSNEPNPTHTYEAAGEYEASLIIFDGYRYDTTTLDITVFPLPTAEWSYNPSICTPEQIDFTTESADDIVSWSWIFEDGTTSAEASPSLSFSSPGITFTGTLTLESAAGCINEIPLEVDIPEAYALELALDNLTAPTCATANGSVALSVSGGVMPFEYIWAHDAALNESVVDSLPAGDYVVTVIDANGCSDDLSLYLIDDTEVPMPALGPDAGFCAGEGVPLSVGDSFSSVQWLLDGVPIDGAMDSIYLPTQSGTYGVVVVSEEGCMGEGQVDVTVHPLPNVNLGGDLNFCLGDSVTIGTEAVAGYDYVWSEGAMGAQISISTSGQYVLTVTSGQGCTASDSLSATALPAPIVDLGEDIALCEGETASLTAGSMANDTYSWSNGAAAASLEVSTAGTYAVTVTNELGCSEADMVTVTFLAPVIASIQASGEVLCPGDTLRLIGEGGAEVLWIDTSFAIAMPTVAEVAFIPESTAVYGLIVSNRCFSDTAYVTVGVADRQAFVSPDTCIAYRRDAVLETTGSMATVWWDAARTSILGKEAVLTVSPDSTTLYRVELVDTLGCAYWDSVLVEILYLDDFKPDPINIITPNGDGYNDVLEFANLTKFDTYSLTIFNRHGMTVYDSFNYQNDWDGTRNGSPLPEGVYFYILRIGQIELKSSLTLIRD